MAERLYREAAAKEAPATAPAAELALAELLLDATGAMRMRWRSWSISS